MYDNMSQYEKRENVNSEDLWWKVFGECGVVETEYNFRHLIDTVDPSLPSPPPSRLTLTGMVFMAQLTRLDFICQVSAWVTTSKRLSLIIDGFPSSPAQLFYIVSSQFFLP